MGRITAEQFWEALAPALKTAIKRAMTPCLSSPPSVDAFGHINLQSRRNPEVAHLAHLNAGLKVLVTRVDYRGSGISDAQRLAQSVCSSGCYRQPDDHWLLIFGPWLQCLDLPNIDFHAFRGDGNNFVELTPHQVISCNP